MGGHELPEVSTSNLGLPDNIYLHIYIYIYIFVIGCKVANPVAWPLETWQSECHALIGIWAPWSQSLQNMTLSPSSSQGLEERRVR